MKKTLTALALLTALASAKAQIYNPAPYCSFRSFFAGNPSDNITGLKLNTINATIPQSDSCDLYYNGDTATTLTKGTTYPLTIKYYKPDVEYMVISVFIDYNHNNTFDSDEVAFNQNGIAVQSYDTDFTLTGNITVPATALTGETRMRVMIMDPTDTSASVAADPCAWSVWPYGSNPYYGDAIDYNVVIVGTTRTGIDEIANEDKGIIYPNPATSVFYLGVNLIGANVTILDMLGKRVLTCQSVKSSGVDISSLSAGMYIVQVAQGDRLSNQRLCVSK